MISKKRRKNKTYNFIAAFLEILFIAGCIFALYLCKDVLNLSSSVIVESIILLVCLNILIFVFVLSTISQRTSVLLKVLCIILEIVLVSAISLGSYFLYQTKRTVDNIVDDGSNVKGTYQMVFASYENVFSSIEEMDRNTRLGYIDNEYFIEGNIMALKTVEDKGILSELVEYNNYVDMIMGLVKGNIDVAALPGSFASIYANDDVVKDYVKELNVFYTYNDDIEIAGIGGNDIDVSKDSFTILFMGCDDARSDSLILVTVNPKTLTATMTSIPRDSYVPISCYKNQSKDKITHAHAVNRFCTMETVSNLFNIDVNFYVDVNFDGVVEMVDAMGGLWLELDKPITEYWTGVVHEEGLKLRTGREVLGIARERYSLNNGDYGREDNQRKVIKAVLNQLLNLKDINTVLEILEAAGNNLSTNFSISQLISLFDLGLDSLFDTEVGQTESFEMYTILSNRISGYSDYFYSYDYEMPLWTMHPYNGSISDNNELMRQNMIINSEVDFAVDKGFNTNDNYRNVYIIKESYDERREYNEMPDYTPSFIGTSYSLKDIIDWCQTNNKELEIQEVREGDSLFNNSYSHNQIISQNPAYGKLLNMYDTLKVWIVKKEIDCTLEENLQYEECQDGSIIPYFKGMTVDQVRSWLKLVDYDVRPELKIEYVNNDGADTPNTVRRQEPYAGTPVYMVDTITIYVINYPYGQLPGRDFVGKTKGEIDKWFKDNWSTNPTYDYWYEAKYGDNVVVTHVYRGNSPIEEGSSLLLVNDSITIYLNKIYLKNLVGMTLKQAETQLDRLGVTSHKSHITYVDTNDESLNNIVKSQNMTANTEYSYDDIRAIKIEVYQYNGQN